MIINKKKKKKDSLNNACTEKGKLNSSRSYSFCGIFPDPVLFFSLVFVALIILMTGVSHVLVHLVFTVMLWMLSLFPLTDNGLGAQTLPSVTRLVSGGAEI